MYGKSFEVVKAKFDLKNLSLDKVTSHTPACFSTYDMCVVYPSLTNFSVCTLCIAFIILKEPSCRFAGFTLIFFSQISLYKPKVEPCEICKLYDQIITSTMITVVTWQRQRHCNLALNKAIVEAPLSTPA